MEEFSCGSYGLAAEPAELQGFLSFGYSFCLMLAKFEKIQPVLVLSEAISRIIDVRGIMVAAPDRLRWLGKALL